MRIAALYDIHGSLRALEAVLADVDRIEPDVILVGGDVALGPMPRETLELLFERGRRVRWIRGNCDREMVAAARGSATASGPWGERTGWAAARCTPAQLELLATLPTTAVLEVEALGDVLFCHGSPRRDDEILTRITPDDRLRAALEGVGQRLVVSGHTHVQYDRVAMGKRLVNPGSVGMAYADEPGACWALLGPDVSLRRTPYDVERAIADVRASGFPDPEEFIGKYLAGRLGAEEATRFFESMAAASRS